MTKRWSGRGKGGAPHKRHSKRPPPTRTHSPCTFVVMFVCVWVSRSHPPAPLPGPPSLRDSSTPSTPPIAAKAGATCLRLIAQLVDDDVVDQMVPFVTENIQSQNWRQRESAVMAFGAVLEASLCVCVFLQVV